jgi:hypothetical protein
MKPLLDAIGKAIKALQPVLWFVVVVAAITSVFLLLYLNSSSLLKMGCPAADFLHICTLLGSYEQWIGMIAVVSIIMIVVGGVLWVWQLLKPVLFPEQPTAAAKK